MRATRSFTPLATLLAVAALSHLALAAQEDVTRVVVTPDRATVNLGQPLQLTATARNATGDIVDDATFTWTTDKGTVSTDGLLIVRVEGKAIVRAEANGVQGLARITITDEIQVSVHVPNADPVAALVGGLQGGVQVRDVNGAALPGITHHVLLRRATPDPLIPSQWETTGKSDATGAYSFDVPDVFRLPGDYSVFVYSTDRANSGTAVTGYTIG